MPLRGFVVGRSSHVDRTAPTWQGAFKYRRLIESRLVCDQIHNRMVLIPHNPLLLALGLNTAYWMSPVETVTPHWP